jgi:protein TonB
MTENLPHSDKTERQQLNWPRIVGISFVIALHVAALMLLLMPVAPPGAQAEEEEVTLVNFIKPPSPPPPPPPPPPEPPKQIVLKPQTVPKPSPLPPPPEEPPVVFDEPSPVDVQAPPPAPPAPPAAPVGPTRDLNDLNSSICSKPSLAPLQSAVSRARIVAVMRLTLTFTADGTVTDVQVTQSSRDRTVDRAAQNWARRVKLCPGSPGTGVLALDLKQS